MFGFVCFKSVKDLVKMVQAILNVWFGKLKTWASLARFEKEDVKIVPNATSNK